jgi:hypothetical protein
VGWWCFRAAAQLQLDLGERGSASWLLFAREIIPAAAEL